MSNPLMMDPDEAWEAIRQKRAGPDRDRRDLHLAEGVDVEVSEDTVEIVGTPMEGTYRRRRPPQVVVYLLLRGDDVVYVGSSAAIYWRLGHHIRDKNFDSWCCIEVPEDVRFEVERALIYALDPEYNDMCSDSPPGVAVDPEKAEYLKEQHERLPIR